MDIVLRTKDQQNVVLDQIRGDDCSPQSFLPIESSLKLGQAVSFAPVGGRSSDTSFPFFNLDCGYEGLFTAIGWTGQWAAEINRATDGSVHLQAGMELTHLRLHPGEAIRTPRIMLMCWQGDRMDAHNPFRRLLLAHYLPKLDGSRSGRPSPCRRSTAPADADIGPASPGSLSRRASIATRLRHPLARRRLVRGRLFRRAWAIGFPRARIFPAGCAVGDACQRLGLKFLVWYEPEDVKPGTKIAREHPEFILPVHKSPVREDC